MGGHSHCPFPGKTWIPIRDVPMLPTGNPASGDKQVPEGLQCGGAAGRGPARQS